MSQQTKLQRLWYRKLKDSGFKDIEHSSGALDRSYTKSKRTQVEIEVIQYYYSMASALLNDHKFVDPIEKTIWEYYSEGMSAREISEVLEQAGVKKKRHVTVSKIIKRLETIMKVKYLRP